MRILIIVFISLKIRRFERNNNGRETQNIYGFFLSFLAKIIALYLGKDLPQCRLQQSHLEGP